MIFIMSENGVVVQMTLEVILMSFELLKYFDPIHFQKGLQILMFHNHILLYDL